MDKFMEGFKMIQQGDRVRFEGEDGPIFGVVKKCSFCDMGSKLGYPEGDHYRAVMACDPGQYSKKGHRIVEIEGNVAFFKPTKEMTMEQFLIENPACEKAFQSCGGVLNGL